MPFRVNKRAKMSLIKIPNGLSNGLKMPLMTILGLKLTVSILLNKGTNE